MKSLKHMLAWVILIYLRFWAKLAVMLYKPSLIGIAGSVGKSSTRNAVATVLSSQYPIRVIETNSETGLPLGILGVKPYDYSPLDWLVMILKAPLGITYIRGAEYLVIEMGIDDPYPPKNMEYLLTIVSPHIGIITYESAAHTMQFEKALQGKTFTDAKSRSESVVEAIAREDLKLLKNPACKFGIINADSTHLMNAVRSSDTVLPPLSTFGFSGNTTLSVTQYRVSTHGTSFRYTLRGHTHDLVFPRFCLPREYAGTFAAAILVADLVGIPIHGAINALESEFTLPAGRAGLLEGLHGWTILDSSYNSSKPTCIAYLKLLGDLRRQTGRPAVAILADMLELGTQEKTEHEDVARAIPGNCEYVYLVGPLTRTYIAPILKKSTKVKDVRWFADSRELNAFVQDGLPTDSIILVKGSQGQLWLEETIKLLLKNKSDIRYLCRQNAFWQKRKKATGRWIEITDDGRQLPTL